GVVRMNQGTRPVVRADNEGRRTMSVDVVGASLCVILDGEYCCIFPVGTGRYFFNQATNRVIIVSYVKLWSGLAGSHPRGMIVGKPNYRHIRHSILSGRLERFDVPVKLRKPGSKSRRPSKSGI